MDTTNGTTWIAAALAALLLASGAPAQVPGGCDGTADGSRATREQRTIVLPAMGLTVVLTKTVDLLTGEGTLEFRDTSGRRWEYADLLAGERAARQRVPAAKFHPRLAAAVARDPSSVLPAVAWLGCDVAALDAFAASVRAGSDPDTATPDVQRELEARIERELCARMADLTQPFAAWLRTAGIRVRATATTAPVVFLDATGEELLALAALPGVDTLYLETADHVDADASARATHRTDRVHRYGVRGSGTRVAVLEDNGISPYCPHLAVAGWYDPMIFNPDDHVHATSGCLSSRLPARLGAAPDAELYSANAWSYSDSDVTDANGWIAVQNVEVVNLSFGPANPPGTLQYIDRYFDFQARYLEDSYVAAAGNGGNGLTVSWPGWNVVTVGSHADNGTADWADDAMSTFSRGGNPATACEKPSLAAVGQGIDTLGFNATWLSDGQNGTSFAAPFASGSLATAIQVNGWLWGYPQSAMALMMATAWHNIEGAARLSGLDGAGGMVGLAAYRCASSSGNVTAGQVTTASFNTPAGTYIRNVWLQGGDKTRICFAWFSDGDSSYTTTVLQSDLDIRVIAGQGQGSGTVLASSTSLNNNFEIVEFTPAATGWYSVNVSAFLLNSGHEIWGMAVSQKTRDTSSFSLRARTAENAPLAGPTLGNPAYFMDLQAPGSPGAGWLCVPSGTLGDGFSFSPETWCPLAIDGWTSLFFDNVLNPVWFWSDYLGTLDATGAGVGNRMAIPNVAFLEGLTLNHVGFTLAAGFPDSVKEVSEVHTFKFWPAGTVHPLADNGSFEQPLPFPFRFFGTLATSVWVNANGNLTFGAPDADPTPTEAEFLAGRPRIAALWRDLDPSAQGSEGPPVVRVREVVQNDREVVIEFISVPRAGVQDANTFRITLRPDNSIRVEYLDCGATDGIVGVSPGFGLSSAAPTDLGIHGAGTLFTGPGEAFFEVFSGAAQPLDLSSVNGWWNEIRFVPHDPAATTYRVFLDVTR